MGSVVLLVLALVLATAGAWAVARSAREARRASSLQARLELTEAAAAEAAAAAAARLARLEAALDAVRDGVVVCDPSGTVVFRNRTATAMLGEGAGASLVASAVERGIEVALASEHRTSEESVDLFGPPRRALVLTAYALDGEGGPGVVAVLVDVSERRHVDAVRRDFVANMSHELKTPVGALGLLAEALAGETDPEVSRRLAARMQDEAMRVNRIIEDLLDLSRIESDEDAGTRLPVPVAEVIALATDRLRPAAEHGGVDLEVDAGPGMPIVLGDQRQLVSAVHGLVENAIAYTEAGGVVRVSARVDRAQGRVRIEVADTGVGIPSRDLDRIFERFYRVDRARARATGGTGLGLAIVRHVAQNHGGVVRVQSQEGVGSTFTLELPAGTPVPRPTQEAVR